MRGLLAITVAISTLVMIPQGRGLNDLPVYHNRPPYTQCCYS